ncbi:Alpha/beta hydrolase fold-1 [Desarmillaria tabescens]|uniref:Alpha/beta hydrolase fold-1 n=1 Tax=Armillaria tabescens TaxID=1929756 RepID=A0AA39MX84_ARMTA|nr:Alpha/beta hydrolase fold-1 [Desarmillaria tabescens]KAK0450346.1 Alpha/beta hydrolase fold-1 [Desarmillaria tabescens]
MYSELFVLDGVQPIGGRKGPALKMTARRYRIRGTNKENIDGLTLIFAHCIGSHKEQWEPTIERIFGLQEAKSPRHRIREAWAFDWQNHGDAALLNERALRERPEGVSICEWAPAIASFVRSPRMRGHRIVGLGHSAGAGAMMLTTQSSPPYAGLVLIEPTMITEDVFRAHFADRMATMEGAVCATSIRRHRWAGRDDARSWLSGRFPWRVWDERVLDIFVKHGLQEHHQGGVALKCDRKQEAMSYPDVDGHFEATTELAKVCHAVPVHVIWGTYNDLVPNYFQDCLIDASQGRYVASMTRVRGAGHMIVQEKPDLLAETICDVLDTIGVNHRAGSSRSRL